MLDHPQMKRLLARAMASGATRESMMTFAWDVSGNCTDAVMRELHSRPSPKDGERYIVVKPGTQVPLLLRLSVRCRKCDNCRRKRSSMWTHRAQFETLQSYRTWFGTLTLSPDQQFRALTLARARLGQQGIDFDTLPYGEQFAERHRSISREITLFLKRVRKDSGAPLRYLLVAEPHKSGEPHYHMLVHETDAEARVTERCLSKQWVLGFSKWRLVNDPKVAAYICKYLSKSLAARVRASLNYGTSGDDLFQTHGLDHRTQTQVFVENTTSQTPPN